jgi:hypothetical protein
VEVLIAATGDLSFGDKISLTPEDFTAIVTTGDMNFFEDFFFCFVVESSCFSTCLARRKYNNRISAPMQIQ